jgi:hypothetical protein
MKRVKRKCRSLFLILMVPASAPISLSQGKIRIIIRIIRSTILLKRNITRKIVPLLWGCAPGGQGRSLSPLG